MNQTMCKVMLVDDHALMRAGVRVCLESTGLYEVIAEASSVAQARDLLEGLRSSEGHHLDILITDLSLGHAQSGADLIAAVQANKQCAIVVLSMHSEPAFIKRMMALGAQGYVLKDDPSTTLLLALESVRRGAFFISPSVALDEANIPRYRGKLTPKEVEILKAIALGLSSKKMAQEMSTSVRTVEAHRLRLRRKLQLDSADSLALYAHNYAALELHTGTHETPHGCDAL